ncbi:MAG: immunoglobulin-like domain-containing protein [Spirochaetota bacterium]
MKKLYSTIISLIFFAGMACSDIGKTGNPGIPLTDDESVVADLSALAISFGSGESAGNIKQNITLPTTGSNGTTITWATTDSDSLTIGGIVTRPAYTAGNASVTLTATITKNSTSDTKIFNLTVIKNPATDAQAVADDKSALAITYGSGDSAGNVTQNVILPTTGSSGTTITWATTDSGSLTIGGIVTRPAYTAGNASVTLTATITKNVASDTKLFNLTVTKNPQTDAEAVAADKTALAITYGSGDSAGNVTQNITLPTTGSSGTIIAWATTNSGVVTIGGIVTRPIYTGSDASVTLTATITKNAAIDTKIFNLTIIKNAPTDTDAVTSDKAALAITYGSGDSAGSVTQNVTLPTTGSSGTTIAWASNNSDNVLINGGTGSTTRPSGSNVSVTLTATISKNAASDTRDFVLTVIRMSPEVDTANIAPGNGAIQVDLGKTIVIPFLIALDGTTVTLSSVLVSDGISTIAGTVSYNSGTQSIIFVPTGLLAQGTTYTVTVTTDVKKADTNPISESVVFSFTTISYADMITQWKFNGNGNDSSGNDNSISVFSTAYMTDKVHEGSNSIYFNGSSAYGTSNINLGNQLTVTLWVNMDNPIKASLNTILANAGPGNTSNGFKLCVNNWNTSDKAVVIEIGDGSYGGKFLTGPGFVIPGGWYHLAFVIDKTNKFVKIYFNGVEAVLGTDSWNLADPVHNFSYGFNTNGPFTIGAFSGGGSYNFKGYMDDLRVYNKILSADVIAKIAQEK